MKQEDALGGPKQAPSPKLSTNSTPWYSSTPGAVFYTEQYTSVVVLHRTRTGTCALMSKVAYYNNCYNLQGILKA
jgi:hypothetical protein